MEYFNKIVCVTFEELANRCDGEPVVNRNTLDSLIRRGRIRRVTRGGGLDNHALIDYLSIPDRYRLRFEQKYGDPVELIKENCMKESIRIDDAARKFFEDYRYDKAGETVSLTERKKEEYTINASVLNELVSILNDRVGYRKALGGSVKSVWETITGTSERLRASYGHTLPENAARLKDKINRYRKEGYSCLISKKMGNDNTLKITGEAGDTIIALKRSRVPVYTDAQIFVEFNRIAGEKGWKQLRSIQSLRGFLNLRISSRSGTMRSMAS